MSEYRIEFSIQRRDEDAEDFAEIGFGSSGARSDVDQAAFDVESIVQNREWETSGDMPEPNRSEP
jgi:hypothetical protein